ncbi:MAG: DUF2264 domain-containing protein [Prevotella sp.]|nr:DUF2264 domain-containing protein [Prevotella sp.]
MAKNRKNLCISLIFSIFTSSPVLSASNGSMDRIVDEALDFSLKQSIEMYKTLKGQPGKLPRTIEDNKLLTCRSDWWTSGFFPGTLWYLYEYSGDESVRKAAEEMSARVEKEQFTTTSHDIGFIINCSFGNAYRITGKEAYRKIITTAAHSLSTRFHPKVGCIRSWNSRKYQFSVIIDNMMNLELLTVASSYLGDNTYYNMAKSHADKTLENHFRPDGSSFQVVSYDSINGKIINQITHQGVSNASSWSRGQAWGLYGFTMMYRQTGKKEYLEQAVKIGRFIMNHPNLPKDKIPYWDFDAPRIPNEYRDASAGAVMASAYIELSTYVNEELSRDFIEIAEQQLKSLASPAYRAAKTGDNHNFILQHSTGFIAKNYEIDAPLAYADYYFVEALLRYRKWREKQPVADIITAYSENTDRALWLSALDRIAKPLLGNMSKGELKKNMPVESNALDMEKRREVTHLEALGRLITGIAPWIELGADETPEGRLREKYIRLALQSIANGVNPSSPDYLNFNNGRQPLVDAAFLAHGLLRARTQLWDNLDKTTRQRIIRELKSSRIIQPSETNWLFFSAMVEAALKEFTGEWEFDRVQYALEKHKQWYKGDGWYGDGPNFHFDYYNSFVIQPMMVEILSIMKKHGVEGADFYDVEIPRYTRYAEQQERLISPEGTYPVTGRSLAYRFGAFHALSDVAYRNMLPGKLDPAQVRCGLSAVIRRQINADGTFNADGWLRVGLNGYQPTIGETYISTGSLYLCAAVFIALGLPETAPFWSNPPADWTSKKAWNGIDLNVDKALKD